MTFDSNTVKLYVDGGYIGQNTSSLTQVFNGYWRMGSYMLFHWPLNPSGNNGYFNGTLDEVHVSTIARNSNWISTEYNNQANPSNFYSVRSEEKWWKC